MITGASGNLGSAIAGKCFDLGANVILIDKREDVLRDKFSNWDENQVYFAAPVDVTDQSSMDNLAQVIINRYGRIHALINTVGAYRAGSPLHETTEDVWEFMYTVNVKSVVVSSRAVIPFMLRHGSGKIVNIISRAALKGGANSAAYSASKAAVMRITESMSSELKIHGINVNSVIPGTMDTPQNREEMPNSDRSKWVSPDSVADAIIFLITDGAKDIHGVAIPIYGLT